MSHLQRRIIKRLKSDGLASCLRFLAVAGWAEVTTTIAEARRGIDTEHPANHRQLGILNPENHWYKAAAYDTFQRAMRHVTVRPGQDVFVDFGSGKGRIVVLAAEYPFRRVIGVEFVESLHRVAKKNLSHRARHRVCQDIQLIRADATQWPIPADANILFFYNPFEGAVLAKVWENIRQSLHDAPRFMTIVYVRPEAFFESQIRWQELLTCRVRMVCREGTLAIYEHTPATGGINA
ncbi:MAG: hypothetical protein PCFJNLEI_02232 [Verrucomicrobiae bacterium]|nr:hypothetical protein [Verrucomicrobiae bacterium]